MAENNNRLDKRAMSAQAMRALLPEFRVETIPEEQRILDIISRGRARPQEEATTVLPTITQIDLYNSGVTPGLRPDVPGMPGSSVMVQPLPRSLGQPVSAPVPSAVSVPVRSQTGVAAVEGTGAAAIDAGQEYGSRIVENQRERGFLESLLGGDLGGFVQNFLKMSARPEFLRPGFEGQGIDSMLMGMAEAQAGIRADEKAKEQRALKALKEQRELEAGRRRELRDIESLELQRQREARQKAEATRKAALLTKPQMDALKDYLQNDPQVGDLVDELNKSGIARFVGLAPETDEILTAIATRATEIRAGNPELSIKEAGIQAASELAGRAATAASSGGVAASGGADPFANVGR